MSLIRKFFNNGLILPTPPPKKILDCGADPSIWKALKFSLHVKIEIDITLTLSANDKKFVEHS